MESLEALRHSADPKKTDEIETQTVKISHEELAGLVHTSLDITPFCQCRNCQHWTTSIDWCTTKDFDYNNKPQQAICKGPSVPLTRPAGEFGKRVYVTSFSKPQSRLQRQAAHKVLVHGEYIPCPVDKVSRTSFSEQIVRSLSQLNYIYTTGLQSFAWPSINRNLNVFLVGTAKSGKTMAYLPAIASSTLHVKERGSDLKKYDGPISLILCRTSEQCEDIYSLLRKILKYVENLPKIAVLSYPFRKTYKPDFVITMPSVLVECLEKRIFGLKQLRHLVLENASTVLKFDNENMKTIFKVVNQMLEHRVTNQRVQLIVTSEKWTSDVEELLERTYLTPIVCFQNYLEAALYGKIGFNFKFSTTMDKMSHLEKILENKYHIYKTIIICDDSEVNEVFAFLTSKNINCLRLCNESSKDEVNDKEDEWQSAIGGKYKVLLCSDFVLGSHLCITDAMWLIHYSFPSSWSKFTKRFISISDNIESPLNSAKDEMHCCSFLMFDENCMKQIQIIDCKLLKRLKKDLPDSYNTLVENVIMSSEDEKIKSKLSLCNHLKLFGRCPTPACTKRHCLDGSLDVSKTLPQNGKIHFRILDFIDVTKYTIQLVEHVSLSGEVNMYDIDHERVQHKEAVTIDPKYYYLLKFEQGSSGEIFYICTIKRTLEGDLYEVKVLQDGRLQGSLLQVSKKLLYDLPKGFLVMTMYLCNLVPPYNDEMFSIESVHETCRVLDDINYTKLVLSGDVFLQMDNTVWVDNVYEITEISGIDFVKTDLKKLLRERNVVKVFKGQIALLHKLCAKYNVSLPNYVKPKKVAKPRTIESQEAFLDERVNEVILSAVMSPNEFYIRLAKFDDLLEKLQKDIQEAIKKDTSNATVSAAVGKYYLVKDPQLDDYVRALVLNVDKDKALCFFVDYGEEALVNICDIKNIPSKLFTRLPFQAIQCNLHGVSSVCKVWQETATDQLYNYMFEPDSSINRRLFAKTYGVKRSETIRTKMVYSIGLKDGYDSQKVLLNELLISCGEAVRVDHFDDFDLPEEFEDTDEGNSENAENENCTSHSGTFQFDNHEGTLLNEDDFDVVVHDVDSFLSTFATPFLNLANDAAPRNDTGVKTEAEKIKEVDESEENMEPPEHKPNHYTPSLYWSQTDDHVRIRIQLIDVEEYKLRVIRKRILLFSTTLQDKTYQLKITLHSTAELSKHTLSGMEIVVILNKREAVDWPHLTATKKRLRFIHYEILDNVKEEPKRKFLQLDLGDEEHSEEEGVVFEYGSGIDSDLDDELESDSD